MVQQLCRCLTRPGANRHQNGLVHPDTVHISDQLKHCIHPEFIRDQLTRSLERLKLEHVNNSLLRGVALMNCTQLSLLGFAA